ncbi:MAG TPA: hypothetical protein VGK10_11735 [Prolixibacteraceae bacterium]|jgi:hypothetical protein
MKDENNTWEAEQFNYSFVGFAKHLIPMKVLALILLILSLSSYATPRKKPLTIREQGSFAIGGTVISNPGKFDPFQQTPEGQTLHGDHAYVFYQIL